MEESYSEKEESGALQLPAPFSKLINILDKEKR